VEEEVTILMETESYCTIPKGALTREREIDEYLSPLYKSPGTYPNRTITVAEQDLVVNSFHYTAENTSQRSYRNVSSLSYINVNDILDLYRWETKAVVSLSMKVKFENDEKKVEEKFVTRVFCAPCQLISPDKSLLKRDQYILIMIGTTFCSTARNDFWVLDTQDDKVQTWEGTNYIRKFWCDFDAHIDLTKVREARNIYLDRYSLYTCLFTFIINA
jgi:hypothetical protein